MMDMVGNFTKQVEFVLDCFEGTFAVAKAFFLVPKHRRLVGLDMDHACLEIFKECFWSLHSTITQLRFRFDRELYQNLS